MKDSSFSPPVRIVCAAILIALAVLVCFHKLALHPGEVLVGPQSGGENDLVNYYIPSREFLRQGLIEDHTFPFWNPYLAFGTAYVGNAQSAVYYPPNWLTILFEPTRFMSWLQLAHHWWAGLGLFLLCSYLGLNWMSCLFAGISLATAPFFIAQGAEGHYAQIAAASWMPWAFLTFKIFLERQSWKSVLCVSFCLSMSFFSGHVQETYYLVLVLTTWLVCSCTRRVRDGNPETARALAIGWGKAGLLTLGIVAIDLIPIYFNSRTTSRGLSAVDPSLMGWNAYDLQHLWQLVSPFAIDRPEIWQRGTPPFWEKLGYFGILTTQLALIGIVFNWNKAWVRGMTVLLLLTFLFALGTNGFLFPMMLKLVPGTSWFRLPPRIFFLTSLCFGFLAANGLSCLLSPNDRRPLWTFVGLSIVSSLAVVTQFALSADAGVLSSNLFRNTLLILPVLALIIGGISCVQSKRLQRLLAISLLMLTTAETSYLSSQITDTARVVPLDKRNPQLTDQLEQLKNSGELGRVITTQEVLSDFDAISLRIAKTRGYDPAPSVFYNTMIYALAKDADSSIDPTGFSQVRLDHLNQNYANALGITHAIQIRRKGFQLPPPGWNVIYSCELEQRVQRRGAEKVRRYPVDLLRNDHAFPVAYLTANPQSVDLRVDPRQVAREFDFERGVLINTRQVRTSNADLAPIAVAGLYRTTNQVNVDLAEPQEGSLAVNELWFPGWTASVDGQSTRLDQANYAVRAVPFKSGAKKCELSFRPQGIWVGSTITILSLLMALVMSFQDRAIKKAADEAA